MRIWAPAAAILFAACACACAQAQTRGELRFVDGTLLPGVLKESTTQGGLFHSARFGEVRFTDAEAKFTPIESAEPPLPAVETPPAQMSWRPNSWSIGLSGYWQSDNGTQESDLGLDFASTWTSPRDELNWQLSLDYKVVNDVVDNNEQSGRVRWLHDLTSPWVSLATVRAQRHTFTVDPLPEFDYLLTQGTLGLGVRNTFSNGSHTLVALGHDWVALRLLKYDRTFHTDANSLLLESHIKLTSKLSLEQTFNFYIWQDGDSGIDSLADLNYAVTERLSVGLRHEFRRNAVNLDVGTFNKLSLTTRLGF